MSISPFVLASSSSASAWLCSSRSPSSAAMGAAARERRLSDMTAGTGHTGVRSGGGYSGSRPPPPAPPGPVPPYPPLSPPPGVPPKAPLHTLGYPQAPSLLPLGSPSRTTGETRPPIPVSVPSPPPVPPAQRPASHRSPSNHHFRLGREQGPTSVCRQTDAPWPGGAASQPKRRASAGPRLSAIGRRIGSPCGDWRVGAAVGGARRWRGI